jgi:hypothetical protein
LLSRRLAFDAALSHSKLGLIAPVGLRAPVGAAGRRSALAAKLRCASFRG